MQFVLPAAVRYTSIAGFVQLIDHMYGTSIHQGHDTD